MAVSRDAADMMIAVWGIDPQIVQTVPNGVDTDVFHPAPSRYQIEQTRRDIELDDARHVVICVANLFPIKGIEVLLRAWRQVSMADPDARLIIVGDGPMRGELEQLACQWRCDATTRFLGSRNDVPALLRASDLFVLPSRYEGCSNACLEAMATGLPVIACDVGGMSELITHHRTGWLVPPEAPDRLARMMLAALMGQPTRSRIGQAACEAVGQSFTLDDWVDRYATLYRELIGRSRPLPASTSEEPVCVG